MRQQIKISPVNSLLFIEDVNGGTPPEPVWGAKILSTPSCISFACFPEQDGPTEITIGPSNEIEPGPLLVFEGDLETPSRKLIISGVEIERVLSVDVAHQKAKVRIWYSHPKWPDKVTISVD
ncbi:MAG: hypothetical protein HYX37_04270 [Rhizobiales bacterium]|nr:hypothetical protein [Hyphomicrobiales bacterium]